MNLFPSFLHNFHMVFRYTHQRNERRFTMGEPMHRTSRHSCFCSVDEYGRMQVINRPRNRLFLGSAWASQMDQEGSNMKRSFFGAMVLGLAIVVPIPTQAGSVDISIVLPPPVGFSAPPEVVVIPGTYAYFVPGIDVDIFFYNGYWWRPWQGRWYRSRHYQSGWDYYRGVPSFYRGIPPGWRNDYGAYRWKGYRWTPQRVPYHQLERNWSGWQRNKHWEKQQKWGVDGWNSRPPSQKERWQHQQRDTRREPVRQIQHDSQGRQKDRQWENPGYRGGGGEKSRPHPPKNHPNGGGNSQFHEGRGHGKHP